MAISHDQRIYPGGDWTFQEHKSCSMVLDKIPEFVE